MKNIALPTAAVDVRIMFSFRLLHALLRKPISVRSPIRSDVKPKELGCFEHRVQDEPDGWR
jgi:hypothetical protein